MYYVFTMSHVKKIMTTKNLKYLYQAEFAVVVLESMSFVTFFMSTFGSVSNSGND